MKLSILLASIAALLVQQTKAKCWKTPCPCINACSSSTGDKWCNIDPGCPGGIDSYVFGYYKYCTEVRCSKRSCCSGATCGIVVGVDGRACCPDGGAHYIYCVNGGWLGYCEQYGSVPKQVCPTPAPVFNPTPKPTPQSTLEPTTTPTSTTITLPPAPTSTPEDSVTSDAEGIETQLTSLKYLLMVVIFLLMPPDAKAAILGMLSATFFIYVMIGVYFGKIEY